MSGVRVLVGTRKGAFVLSADGKRKNWNVEGPFFAGWELYHLKGSPADSNRIYASQCSGWFGQIIQRSDDGGATWNSVNNKFTYDGTPKGVVGAAYGVDGVTPVDGTFAYQYFDNTGTQLSGAPTNGSFAASSGRS